MRPIDADVLKDRFENLAYDDWNQGVETTLANTFREAADMVEDAPTIEVSRWIPVTERLPEYGIDVLTDNGYGDYEINHTIGGGWYWEPVAAWMPLPEPWKGGAE